MPSAPRPFSASVSSTFFSARSRMKLFRISLGQCDNGWLASTTSLVIPSGLHQSTCGETFDRYGESRGSSGMIDVCLSQVISFNCSSFVNNGACLNTNDRKRIVLSSKPEDRMRRSAGKKMFTKIIRRGIS